MAQTVQTSGVCCLQGLACTTDLDDARCVAAGGTWHSQFTSCHQGLPCFGATGVGETGACCFEYQCVDATTPGLENISEVDCLLGGGRWLSGLGCGDLGSGDLGSDCLPVACLPVNIFDCDCTADPVDLTEDCLTYCSCDCAIPPDARDEVCKFYCDAVTFDDETCWQFGGSLNVPLGDVNGDGHVGGLDDLVPLVEQWGEPSPNADLNGNGTVDVPDLLILLEEWE